MLRRVTRSWQVFVVILRWFVLPALPLRRGPHKPGAERTRKALEELGGAWVKLGQMLAMRFDLLPAAYCEELLKLLNAVPPFPYSDVREIVRQELGAPPEELFTSFVSEPFASASIGQVHKAKLPTGENVAVKVQRPRIREIMRADIDLMYSMTALLDWTRFLGATDSRVLIDEFARWTADELDYLIEARQSVLLYENAQDDELERVARVYRGYTTSRVLTAELIEGIPLVNIVVAVRARDSAYLTQLKANGFDLEQIVRHLDWNMLNQVYVFGCFHADLHPANLYILPGNVIGYVDFGMVGRLSQGVRESLIRYSWLLFHWEIEAAVRELMRWFAPTSMTDAAQARLQLARVHEGFLYALANEGDETGGAPAVVQAEGRNPYTMLAFEIMDTVRRNHLTLAADIVAFLRMLVMLGSLRHQLATDYDLPSVARRFFGRLIQQQGQAWLDPRLAVGRVYGATYRAKRALEFVEFLQEQQPLIASLAGSYFGFQRRIQNIRRRAVSLGLAVLAIGAALYFTLADPDRARLVTPPVIPFESMHLILLTLLLLLLAWFVQSVSQLAKR
ncbi:MAG TPA: AarF/UbiB family protein [Chloroflexota bacterium]|nr:AarF/UbiB family protein [Chloroflexota bacterium]